MAKNQITMVNGFITVRVTGPNIESFMQNCVKEGCYLFNVKYFDEQYVHMSLRLQDWPTFRKLRKSHKCKIKILTTKGFPFAFNRMKKKTAVWIAFFCSLLAVFLLANTLWSIKIDGLDKELEARVESRLISYGIQPGSMTFSMKQPREVQRLLLEDIPDLLWVGVKKQGTSYQLYGVMQTNYDEEEEAQPSDIVATKKGLVTKMFISKGRPLVEVNDVVKKGELLATGELKEDSGEYIESVGEVIAETWYRVEIDAETQSNQVLTDGNSSSSYSLLLHKFKIPVWGFWRKNEKEERVESYDQSFHLFGWETPISMQKNTFFSKDILGDSLSKKDSIKVATETAQNSLLLQLEEGAKIIEGKILHQREENGKVKLILLFKIQENIAETKYVSQGD
ncbi:sporulation protein YqfD [Halobacillus seohaensis]|uniref:Sporulation protein YqfD n=1 Tax=Halobacillus seohaensis TaxID=447421 RepID=A0ABW2EEU9_9BACI